MARVEAMNAPGRRRIAFLWGTLWQGRCDWNLRPQSIVFLVATERSVVVLLHLRRRREKK
jgi:hypothetical protein